jgi:YhcH/YjgK/YiaL family protein
MVIGNLTESEKYGTLSPAVSAALAWLRDNIGCQCCNADSQRFEDGNTQESATKQDSNANAPESGKAIPFEDGKTVTLAGGDIIVNPQEVELKPAEGCLMEAHREWVDIQVAVDTPEQIGWAPTASCTHVAKPYTGDAEFYSDAPQCFVPVLPGQFMILYPEDAHAPNIGSGRHRKYVVKVRVGK